MRALARRVLPIAVAALLLAALALPSARAVPSATAASTLQFYGGEVRAIAQIGNTIYVGGSFTSVGYGSGTIARAYLAALDAASGQLVEGFNPKPDNAVDSLLKSADGTRLYAGGVFNRIGGCTPCDRLAALNPATGAANPTFHPQPNASVLKMALYGRTLYLGGKFTAVAGVARSRLAAVDAITGGLSTRLTLAPNQAVRDLALNPTGSTLYLAGSFTSISGTTRYNFASVGTASRALTAWNPNIHARGWGVALSPDGATAYLTTADGNESICGAGHESVIAMPATGSGTPAVKWHNGGDRGCPFNSGDVNAVEATASAVYVGGHLTNLCTVRNTSYTSPCPGALTVREHVAALDPATGVPLSWNPGADGNKGVLAIQAIPAGLGVGGDFQRTNGVAHSRFALFRGTA
jgi:DNA-binding beta-propeller fold protein YncE